MFALNEIIDDAGVQAIAHVQSSKDEPTYVKLSLFRLRKTKCRVVWVIQC